MKENHLNRSLESQIRIIVNELGLSNSTIMETTQILRLLIEREFPLEGRILDALASCLYLARIKTKERR